MFLRVQTMLISFIGSPKFCAHSKSLQSIIFIYKLIITKHQYTSCFTSQAVSKMCSFAINHSLVHFIHSSAKCLPLWEREQGVEKRLQDASLASAEQRVDGCAIYWRKDDSERGGLEGPWEFRFLRDDTSIPWFSSPRSSCGPPYMHDTLDQASSQKCQGMDGFKENSRERHSC